MSTAKPIESWANRLYLQAEPAYAVDSEEPVREFIGKSRFSYAPVQGQGGVRSSLQRIRTEQVSGITHWKGSCDAEYRHGALAAQVFKLMFGLVSEAADSPADGLTTYVFRLRRQESLKTAKLGLEYEPSGPFYVMHGVALDTVRLTATARSLAKLRFDFKARELEQIPTTRDYTHADVDVFNQFNFRTETLGGPCYEDGAEGLSCKLVSGGEYLATEDGFLLTTEDGYLIELEPDDADTEPQPGSAFTVFVNDEEMRATEISFEGSEPKMPARFNRERLADAMKPGPPAASGELALYMNGDEVPAIVSADSYAAIRMVADFGGGRGLTITMPRVKFSSGTPDLVGRGELVYRAPFAVLEPLAGDVEQSSITLTI